MRKKKKRKKKKVKKKKMKKKEEEKMKKSWDRFCDQVFSLLGLIIWNRSSSEHFCRACSSLLRMISSFVGEPAGAVQLFDGDNYSVIKSAQCKISLL